MWKIIFAVGLAFVFYPESNGYPKTFHYNSPQSAAYEDYNRNFPVRNLDKVMEMQEYDQIRKAVLEALIGMGFERIRKNEDNIPCEGKNKIAEPRCMVRRTLNSLVLGGSFKRAEPHFAKTGELFEEEEMDKGN